VVSILSGIKTMARIRITRHHCEDTGGERDLTKYRAMLKKIGG